MKRTAVLLATMGIMFSGPIANAESPATPPSKEDMKMAQLTRTGEIESIPVAPNHFKEIFEVIVEGAPLAPEFTLADLMSMGVINWGGYRFTYYSQEVLPGPGLSIPGRHVNENGFVADEDGFIVLANDAPKGTVFPTPFGNDGKVYDRGTAGNHLDVYTK